MSSWCKGCCQAQSTIYYANNKEKAKLAHKNWAVKNKEQIKIHKIKSSYGITKEQYEAMIKKCYICHKVENLVIDHNHISGRVRGILCSSCNKGLGFFKDNPTSLYRAGDYILGQLEVPEVFRLSQGQNI